MAFPGATEQTPALPKPSVNALKRMTVQKGLQSNSGQNSVWTWRPSKELQLSLLVAPRSLAGPERHKGESKIMEAG